MSMLAENRSRQKWSDDPRNTRWVNDKTKFGYTMLTRMGWSEGKGLGQKLSGETSHIRVKKRNNNAGVGLKKATDDDWISHQEDFNALLSQLNQGTSGNTTSKGISSLEDRVRSSRKKILYTKFVKSKDLSNASTQDLAAIFGTRSAPATPQLSDDDDGESDSASVASCPAVDGCHDSGIQTINSGVNIQDYFAKKMAALKQKNMAVVKQGDQINEETEEVTPEVSKKSKRKKKKSENVDDNNDVIECDEKIKKTKKKKRSREKSDNEEEVTSDDVTTKSTDSSDDVGDEKIKKSKKKKRSREKSDNDDQTTSDDVTTKSTDSDNTDAVECDVKQKKSKKKKRNKEKLDDTSSDDITNDVIEIIDCDDKKKVITIDDDIIEIDVQQNDDCTIVEKPKKKKKSHDVSITTVKKSKNKELSIIECEPKLSKDKKRKKIINDEEVVQRKKKKKSKE